jgi:phospholipase C
MDAIANRRSLFGREAEARQAIGEAAKAFPIRRGGPCAQPDEASPLRAGRSLIAKGLTGGAMRKFLIWRPMTFCVSVLVMVLCGGSLAADARPIKHIIIIMQENRSFDTYFGAFGITNGSIGTGCTQTVDGLCNVVWPTQCTSKGVNGIPINPSASDSACVTPWHDVHDLNGDSKHGPPAAQADIDDGITTAKLDGFAYQQRRCNHAHDAPMSPA